MMILVNLWGDQLIKMKMKKISFTIEEEGKEPEKCFIEIPKNSKPHLDNLANLFFWIASFLGSPLKSVNLTLK